MIIQIYFHKEIQNKNIVSSPKLMRGNALKCNVEANQ